VSSGPVASAVYPLGFYQYVLRRVRGYHPPRKIGWHTLNLPQETYFVDNMPPSVKVEKPWGGFEQYAHNVPCTVKIITVEPGGILSSQYHHHRDELWVILDLGAMVELDEKVLSPSPGEKLYIPRGMVHRLSCTGERSVRVLEVSFGEFAEDDIVRLEDLYGRVDL
jgi:mannose-6-phosphate isomerase